MKKGIIIVSALILVVAVVATIVAVQYFREKAEQERRLKEYPTAYIDEIEKYAAEYDLDPYLVLSIMRCESSFRENAVSPVGAIGLMQIMPDTGVWIAHKLDMDATYAESMLYDADCNVRFGCWFLRFLTNRFSGVGLHIIAAYNAGHGSVEKWLSNPDYSQDGVLSLIPFPETARYVEKVSAAYQAYLELYPDLFTDGSFETAGES